MPQRLLYSRRLPKSFKSLKPGDQSCYVRPTLYNRMLMTRIMMVRLKNWKETKDANKFNFFTTCIISGQ